MPLKYHPSVSITFTLMHFLSISLSFWCLLQTVVYQYPPGTDLSDEHTGKTADYRGGVGVVAVHSLHFSECCEVEERAASINSFIVIICVVLKSQALL